MAGRCNIEVDQRLRIENNEYYIWFLQSLTQLKVKYGSSLFHSPLSFLEQALLQLQTENLSEFPVSFSPFELLQTRYRGSVMAKDLTKFHKGQVKMLAYLISRNHVPTKRGTMFFGIWIDVQGEYFDTTHFPNCLEQYPFQGGGCYLLLGTVEVDFHFPTITIHKMAKMPFIPDPRYSMDKEKSLETARGLHEDISMTQRKPYPQEREIGLPRNKFSLPS